MSKLQSYVTGFFVGTLAGGLVVMLSAPKSGKELRNDFSNAKIRLKTTSNQLKRESIELKNNVIQLSAEGKKTFKNVGIELKNTVNNWKEEVNPTINNLKKDIEALKTKAEQAAIELKRS